LLRGEFMHSVLDRLMQLPVGMDRLALELDDAYLADYAAVFDEVLHLAIAALGRAAALRPFVNMPAGDEGRACFLVTADQVSLRAEGLRALPLAVDLLVSVAPPGLGNTLRSHALEACLTRKIPIPALGAGVGET
jgi:hypothetical protein